MTSPLRLLLDRGARVRGVHALHTKLYLLGGKQAVVTSANLTDAGLRSNHELGFSVRDARAVQRCQQYFAWLWERAGEDLAAEQLAAWEQQIAAYLPAEAPPVPAYGLPDLGARGVLAERSGANVWAASAGQAFVKFFGQANERVDPVSPTLQVLADTGAHWSCTYPTGRRPRRVRDGDTMFPARMVIDRDGPDILVFGRATAYAHVEGSDDASAEDKQRRPWRERWSHYVRVDHGAFVSGTLSNGVSLGELMDELGAAAFASTLENARRGQGNINPRRAYGQQPDVRLSPRGHAWLEGRLDEAFARHGTLTDADRAQLDWPPAWTEVGASLRL